MAHTDALVEQLKPCPNPDCTDSPQVTNTIAGYKWWQVECGQDDCGWIGPARDSEAEAITAWNHRSTGQGAAQYVEALRAARSVLHDALMPDGIYPSDAEPVIAQIDQALRNHPIPTPNSEERT